MQEKTYLIEIFAQKNAILMFILGIVFCYAFTCFLKRDVAPSRNETNKCCFAEFFKALLQSFFSLDYVISKNQKSDDKEERTKYIKCQNWKNLILSFICSITIVLLWYLLDCKHIYPFLLGIVLFRLWSRANEITYSFVKDVVSKEGKKSNLKKQDRISLAIKSLLEEAFLFACVHACLLKECANSEGIAYGIMYGVKSFLPSVIIGIQEGAIVTGILSAYQAFSSVALITLAIASYISEAKAENKRVQKKTNRKNKNSH